MKTMTDLMMESSVEQESLLRLNSYFFDKRLTPGNPHVASSPAIDGMETMCDKIETYFKRIRVLS